MQKYFVVVHFFCACKNYSYICKSVLSLCGKKFCEFANGFCTHRFSLCKCVSVFYRHETDLRVRNEFTSVQNFFTNRQKSCDLNSQSQHCLLNSQSANQLASFDVESQQM